MPLDEDDEKSLSTLEKILGAVTCILTLVLIIVVAVWASQDCDCTSGTTGDRVSQPTTGDNVSQPTSGTTGGSVSQTIKERSAICVMKGGSVTGNVIFKQILGNDITVSVDLKNVTQSSSNKKNGFHVHYYGDITTCKTTGGHYNPMKVNHGAPDSSTRHPGDFGNLLATSEEIIKNFTDSRASLFGEYSIIGRAIVLHGGEDDLGLGTGAKEAGSKANGNAGPRIACCVIGLQSEA